MTEVVITPTMNTAPVVTVPKYVTPVVKLPPTEMMVVYPGNPGPKGDPGPVGPSGTNVVALPYNEWPPVDPQPNTLYLRLAP